MPKFVYDFTEGNRDLKDLLGGKGANLGELRRAGFPTPPGFVVTAGAYLRVLEENGVRSQLYDLHQRSQAPGQAPGAPVNTTTGQPPVDRRPSPTPQHAAPTGSQTPAPTAAPSSMQTAPQPVRGEGEAAAARQPTRSGEPATRQLPVPPRPGTGSTAVQNPPTQEIDQPVGQTRS